MASSSTGMPQATDSALGGQPTETNNGYPDNNGGLVNYYFVFIALVAGVAFMSGVLLYRRRKRAIIAARMGHQNALSRDFTTWRGTDGHRGYWYGRGRSQEHLGRDEGLNELGEAPPAYAPAKERGEEEPGPAVPLQTLSRDDAGLKPPDYEPVAGGPDSPARQARGSGEGSSQSMGRRLIV
ncbi:hypothetical protein LTR53_004795 [Teratosphaeriaceae sp. CCFEE 6253]|nr:hypothetical protein LTR53_004795 [Teratosphaeriaceae sp. CCFEE 6253]